MQKSKCINVLRQLKCYESTQDSELYYTSAINRFEAELGPLDATEYPIIAEVKSWQFTRYIFHLLFTIGDSNPLTEKWFSTVATLHMANHIHDQLLNNDLVKIANGKSSNPPPSVTSSAQAMECMNAAVPLMDRLISNVFPIEAATKFDLVYIQYMASVHTLIFESAKDDATFHQDRLDRLFASAPEKYFKFLLILKATKAAVDSALQKQLHGDLFGRLQSANGFRMLCENLLSSSSIDDEIIRKRTAVIVRIVAHVGHSERFYKAIVSQILSLANNRIGGYFSVCIGCLVAIQMLPDTAQLPSTVRQEIERFFFGLFKELSEPTVLLTGNILIDAVEFQHRIHVLWMAFCSRQYSVNFRTQRLVPYVPMLLEMFRQSDGDELCQLIVRCLCNRNAIELTELLDCILFTNNNDGKTVHPRIAIDPNGMCRTLAATDRSQSNDAIETLTSVLERSQNNLLIYQIFLYLLQRFGDCFLNDDADKWSTALLDEMDDISAHIERVFRRRVIVVHGLSTLIGIKSMHGQFNENPRELIDKLSEIIRKINVALMSSSSRDDTKLDECMQLILSIVMEFMDRLSGEHAGQLVRHLQQYKRIKGGQQSSLHLDQILQHFGGDEKPIPNNNTLLESKFSDARKLCSATEPYSIVNGLHELTKLLRDERDAETIASAHTILAIAIDAIRNEDSYVFLNSISLLAELMNVLPDGGDVVLDSLIAEYWNIGGGNETDIDGQLKYGEAIVRVTELLGPMAYKHKSILINCFLRAAADGRSAELRTSALSNVGSICRLLSYQVHHFFEEVNGGQNTF